MAEWGGQGTRPHGLTLGAKFSLVGGRVGFYLPPTKRCRGRWRPGSAGPASRCRALQRELDCAARTARLGPGLPQVLARLQGAFPAPVLRNMGPRSSLLWGNFPSVGGPLAATLAPSCDNQKCPHHLSKPQTPPAYQTLLWLSHRTSRVHAAFGKGRSGMSGGKGRARTSSHSHSLLSSWPKPSVKQRKRKNGSDWLHFLPEVTQHIINQASLLTLSSRLWRYVRFSSVICTKGN